MGEKKGKGYFFPPWEALFVVLEKQTRLFFAVPAKNRKLNRFVLGRLHVSYSLHLKKKKKYIFAKHLWFRISQPGLLLESSRLLHFKGAKERSRAINCLEEAQEDEWSATGMANLREEGVDILITGVVVVCSKMIRMATPRAVVPCHKKGESQWILCELPHGQVMGLWDCRL